MSNLEEPPNSRDHPAESGFTRGKFLAGAGSLLLLGAAGCGGGSGGSSEGDSGGGTGEGVTIEHKFGTAEVPANVERIVTVGYNEADFALALGMVPVGVRDFIGEFSEESREWAQEELDGAEPELVGGEEINFEAVAALEPDLILGIYSFIDQEQYDLLAQIAPTVAQTDEYADGATPWQEQTLLTGRALGMESRAEEVVSEVEDRFTQAMEQNPEFEGKTVAVTFSLSSDGNYTSLTPDDLRTQLFTALGFRLPEETGEISRERVDLLDQDVLVLIGAEQEALEQDELLQNLDAVREGRVIYFGDFSTEFAGALGFNSPLSIPYALDIAVPQLADAVDALGGEETTS